MSYLVLVLDIMFIIATTCLVWKPIKRIINYRSNTIADYVVLIIYVFNCLPVFFDIILGVPQYVYWYSPFEEVIGEFWTCFFYNIYITMSLIVLCIYCYSMRKKEVHFVDEHLDSWRNGKVDFILIIMPILFAFIKYGFSFFYEYATLTSRGVSSSDATILNQLIMLSVYIYVTRFYSKDRSLLEYVLMIGYFVLLVWICGKRYIIVTILEEVVFLYQITKRKNRKRINLGLVLPVVGLLMIIFSVYYLSNVKVTQAVDYMYGSLRVDFGRDDVTKYAINKVLIRGESIIEYPGQTFLSMIFMFVPRFIWENKPYPHYRYLAASVFNTSILNIPSGITPSLFEMSICNFSWFGIIITMIILWLFCSLADRNRKKNIKVLYLLVITNLLTQSIDSLISLLVVLFIAIVFKRLKIVNKEKGNEDNNYDK